MARTAALLAVLAAVAAALTGCGTTGVDRPNVSATLILDGSPSAAEVGIYVAAARGYDDAEGVRLQIRPGTTPVTGLRRLRSGSATFAVLDIHDLAIARERGTDVVGVMAITQLPSADRARAALRAHGRFATAQRVDFADAPRYPELVLTTTGRVLREQPAVARAAIAAITRGYAEELQDPEAALQLELDRVSPRREAALRAELPRVEAGFVGADGEIGVLDRPALRRWAAWEARAGIVGRAPDVERMFPPLPAR
ncbi:MAG TPA: ABC transporter substrate-binding protein [Solirubrobacteraceae bacterium]|nr:ABC transporter substrate-binding protein [Solirubrobacteraceae bacterium]